MTASNTPRVLLHTVHGSTLYGLAHANSDYDTYVVYLAATPAAKYKMKQNISGEDDVTKVELSRFLRLVDDGSHQALEALYSPEATFDPEYEEMLRNLTPNLETARGKYRRAARSFAFEENSNFETPRADLKRRRHALRLLFNLKELTLNGCYNPRLAPEDAAMLTELASAPDNEFKETFRHFMETSQAPNL